MPQIEVKDTKNAVKGAVDLPDDIFGLSARQDILHDSVVNFLANQRQGTHATKTKGLVSGGGKKPWRQKHTGRARAGSNRSPLWRKGGTVFGPQPRDYSYRLPRALKKRALAEALSAKQAAGEISVLDSLFIEKPKTKEIVTVLRNMELEGKSVLLVLPDHNEAILLSSRNVPRLTVIRAADLNPYTVLVHEKIVMIKDALETVTKVLMS